MVDECEDGVQTIEELQSGPGEGLPLLLPGRAKLAPSLKIRMSNESLGSDSAIDPINELEAILVLVNSKIVNLQN